MISASQYAIGTAKYNAVLNSQGKAAADAQWQAAIDAERNGTPLDTSTWGIFYDQIITDPLAAPLDGANNILGNSFWSFIKSPYVIAAVVILGFFLLGGGPWLGRKLFSK